ncbi:MAG: hypothetical protein WA936_01225 [Erythrobacter sp.]
MNRNRYLGLGTKLRLLLALLDGELGALYKQQGHEFRPRFFPVFQLLLDQDKASVSEISVALQTSQPAATQTLAEMKRLDLVAYQSGNDRRERLAHLTPKALELARELQPTWEAVQSAAQQLDRELPHPLSDVLDEALAALNRKSFTDRIRENNPSPGD